jgi:shikimate dehydrogenase
MINHSCIPLAGVIGSFTTYSRSPALHDYWLKHYGIKGHYVPLNIAQSDLANVLKMMPRMGFIGCNITIPYKETILNFADIVTDRAALIGAANTLIFHKDGKVEADNTDGFGFIANLRQNAPRWQPVSGPATVFGAGGACRAVIAALIEAGVSEIRLANRTRDRADAICSDFGTKVHVYEWVQAEAMIHGSAIVINTTALGMTGKPEFLIPLDTLSPNTFVSDLVYTPLKTRFLIEAEKRGAIVIDGLGMLLHQAVPSFESWFGLRPEVDEATRVAVLSS